MPPWVQAGEGRQVDRGVPGADDGQGDAVDVFVPAETLMSSTVITVWPFDSVHEVMEATRVLERLEREGEAAVKDTAIVVWPKDQPSPSTRQLTSSTDPGALGSPLWGLLMALIFFRPLISAATTAQPLEADNLLAEAGLGDVFVNNVRDHVTPGTASLFLMSTESALDQLKDTLPSIPDVIVAKLSAAQEAALREVFG